MTAPTIFDRVLLAKRRARAAPSFSEHDFLVQRSMDDICERLAIVVRPFGDVLCLGAHGGRASRLLRAAMPGARIVAVDLVAGLQDRADAAANADDVAGAGAECGIDLDPGTVLFADEEQLPFALESFDCVVAPLTLQAVNDLPGALVQIRRVLRPDGFFLGVLTGGDTLSELSDAFAAAELELRGGVSPRVAPRVDVRAMGSLLQRAGFAMPVSDLDHVTVTYETPLDLMRELKAMGASNPLAERSRVPVSRRLLVRASEIYAERYAMPDGRVPATFDLITVTGWAPHPDQPKPLKPGTATHRLADALGVSEVSAGERADAVASAGESTPGPTPGSPGGKIGGDGTER